jgi:hypothetical protein
MSLQSWANNGWLRPHQTSPQEIKDLLAIVDRDLADAHGDISADWRFGIAYNAALKLCTILVHASGFRPEKTLQHYRTIQANKLARSEVMNKPRRTTDARNHGRAARTSKWNEPHRAQPY